MLVKFKIYTKCLLKDSPKIRSQYHSQKQYNARNGVILHLPVNYIQNRICSLRNAITPFLSYSSRVNFRKVAC